MSEEKKITPRVVKTYEDPFMSEHRKAEENIKLPLQKAIDSASSRLASASYRSNLGKLAGNMMLARDILDEAIKSALEQDPSLIEYYNKWKTTEKTHS